MAPAIGIPSKDSEVKGWERLKQSLNYFASSDPQTSKLYSGVLNWRYNMDLVIEVITWTLLFRLQCGVLKLRYNLDLVVEVIIWHL